jgi:hypothetical protein
MRRRAGARYDPAPMIRALRLLVLLFGFGVLVVVLVGLFLPKTWSVERNRLVRAAPERLQAELEDLHTWPAWTPWSQERDASLQIRYDGPARGAGARMSWQGQVLGGGSLTITRATPGLGVEYEIVFAGVDQPARGAVVLAAEPAGTRVTWRDGGELTWNPMHRVLRPVLEAKLGRDFDDGLARLAARVEAP